MGLPALKSRGRRGYVPPGGESISLPFAASGTCPHLWLLAPHHFDRCFHNPICFSNPDPPASALKDACDYMHPSPIIQDYQDSHISSVSPAKSLLPHKVTHSQGLRIRT